VPATRFLDRGVHGLGAAQDVVEHVVRADRDRLSGMEPEIETYVDWFLRAADSGQALVFLLVPGSRYG